MENKNEFKDYMEYVARTSSETALEEAIYSIKYALDSLNKIHEKLQNKELSAHERNNCLERALEKVIYLNQQLGIETISKARAHCVAVEAIEDFEQEA